jgi:hypothetical protein
MSITVYTYSMFQLFSDQCLATYLFHDFMFALGDLLRHIIIFIMQIIVDCETLFFLDTSDLCVGQFCHSVVTFLLFFF